MPGCVRVLDQVVGPEGDGAAGGLEEPDDLLDQGGLAGAVGAQQPVDLAGFHLQSDPVVGPQLPEDLGDLLGSERPVGHELSPSPPTRSILPRETVAGSRRSPGDHPSTQEQSPR